MKKNYKNWFSVLALLIVLFTGCQTESVTEIYSTRETITNTTPLTNFVQRVAMQKTSQDDVIDKSDCFTIKLPYVVTVNNVQISINTATDYQLVQANIDAHIYDNDIVSIHFPVTVILQDYSEKIINSQADFDSLISDCESHSSDFGKINCITINFPITINVYDSNNQIASSVSISSNQLLYSFFENLEDNEFIAISYPITIVNSNGQNVVIASNNQFEDIIKNAVDTCSENINPSLDFIQTITSNPWKITYFLHEYERTAAYSDYTFVFSSDYKVVATKSGISYNGTWSTKVDNGVREFEIKFESDPLAKLNEGWNVFEFSSTQLRFRKVEGSNDNDYLYFEKI